MDGPPPPEEDFSSIPLLDRIVHKNWKARLDGYEALPKLFQLTTSDSDPAFRPYLSDPALLKKIVTDSNAVAQEKALEAVCALVQFSGENSAKTREVVVPALVDKCFGSTRAGTKKQAIELVLRYIEVENGGEGAIRDILPGLNAKQPKIVSTSVMAMNEAYKAFGIKIIPPKETLKALPKVFGHSDKTVRAEGTALVQTLYTYLGQGIQTFLADLKPVQVKELTESFTKLDEENAGQGSGKPTRLTRVQAREREAAELAGTAGDTVEEEIDDTPDPRLLIDEVDIIPKIPANFHTLIASSKWKERKEALDDTLVVVNANPRIKDVEAIGELAKALGKRMTDANVQCVMTAAQVIEGLAKGIGQPFAKHRAALVPPMLERCKERKQNVVDAIGQGLDAFFATTDLPEVTEDILNAAKSKNPQVKEGTTKFLARCLSTTKVPPAKGDIKPISEALVALLEDGFEPVRAAAAEGLGTLLKIVGERQLGPVIDPLDDLRKAKVKEAFEKATIKCKFGAPPPKPAPPPPSKPVLKGGKKAAPAPPMDEEPFMDVDATPKAKPPARLLVKKAPALASMEEEIPPPSSNKMAMGDEDSSPPKPAGKPPARLLTKKPPAAAAPPAPKKLPPAAAAPPAKGSGKAAPAPTSEPTKFKFSSEDAEAQAADLLPAQMAADLADANWKIRLAAMDEFIAWLEEGAAESAECEVLFRFMSKKPGWNEKNFQVSAKVYSAMTLLAETSPTFSKACVVISTAHLAEKLGDMKLKKPAGDTLMIYGEKTSLSFILDQAYDPMSKQKAPKVLADSITWVGQALTEFGIAGLSLRSLVEFLKNGLKNSNAAVRSSATSTLVTLRLFAGPGIKDLLEDLNPQLLGTIETEFSKVDGQEAPVPIRVSADTAAATSTSGAKGKGADPLDELFPRVDLDKLVAGTTILAGAKNDAWKARKEALELLQSILDVGANKRLKPNMGDIGSVLKARLADSNKVVQTLALDIVSRIASGMNKPFEKHSRLLVRPVAEVLADQKVHIRAGATTTLSAIATACEGLDSMVPPIAGALESANPLLRSSLLVWMAEWCEAHPPASTTDLTPWVIPVVSCLEERSADVRKGAQAVLPHIISSAGFDFVMSKTTSLKPASRAMVIPMIQAAKLLAKNTTPDVVPPPAPQAAPAATRTAASAPKPPVLTVETAAAEPAAAVKRPQANLRMRKLDPTSRPESRAESLMEPPPSAGPNGHSKSRPTSVISPTPSSGGFPFSGTSLDAKRSRLAKDGMRWVVEGLPVRKDLPDVLHHQMESTVSKDLLVLLFSKDHNAVGDFVKGLGVISDAYSQVTDDDDGARATLIANSDLCFKYVSTKIHEPQPNLIVRCLDVLDAVVALLTACDYSITEQEAVCFIPTIIHKLGDGRETVRVRVQTLVQTLSKIYPSSRIFQLLLEHGLKSKIAKTRQGALEELAVILKRVGLSVCDPAKVFPVIGSMIGDKDTSVRKAALTALSEVYTLAGEKIWQFVGSLPPKDRSQLEERLKRTAGPSVPPTPTKSEPPVLPQMSRITNGAARPSSPGLGSRIGGIPRPASPAISVKTTRAASPPTPTAPNVIATQLPSQVGGRASPARPRSLLPSRLGPQPRSRLAGPSGISSDHETSSPTSRVGTSANSYANGHQNGHGSSPPEEPSMDDASAGISIVISSILSSDPSRSVDALKKIQKVLDVPEDEQTAAPFKELAEHTEGLVETITLQMSHVFERGEDVAEAGNFRLAKHLIQTLNSFCDHAVLAESLTVEIMTSLLEELTMRLLQTDESPDPKIKDLSRFINMIVLRIFATGRRISVFRSLFALLLQIMKPFAANGTTAESKDAKLAELVLKCVWKMARSIPAELSKHTLDAVELFPAIESFLQAIPPNEWRQRAQQRVPVGDMPLRTIKVIIQHIVAHAPDQVYDQLSEAFDDPSATIVYPYVYRILNSSPSRAGLDNHERRDTGSTASTNGRSTSPTSSRHLSPTRTGSETSGRTAGRRRAGSMVSTGDTAATSPPDGSRGHLAYAESSEPDPDDELITIIDHISSETTGAMHKEGITELHHFLKEYPHKKPKVDKLLDATGPAFRKYIARALASRAAEDEERDVAVADTLSKLERREPSSGAATVSRRTSANGPGSQPHSPHRTSIGAAERRFSAASDAGNSDDKALSRLHDIFRYQGRSSISISSTSRGSLTPQPEEL